MVKTKLPLLYFNPKPAKAAAGVTVCFYFMQFQIFWSNILIKNTQNPKSSEVFTRHKTISMIFNKKMSLIVREIELKMVPETRSTKTNSNCGPDEAKWAESLPKTVENGPQKSRFAFLSVSTCTVFYRFMLLD